MTDTSLRLKKKAVTRQAIAEAAFELAAAKGVDHFVVEDIAARAGYSRRTFANHFSCKEEAIASSLTMTDFLEMDPEPSTYSSEDHTPLSTIELFIKRSFTIDKLKRLNQLISLSRTHPTLRLYVTGALKEVQDFAWQGMRKEFGTAYADEYYHVLIGAVFGALMPVLDESIDVQLPAEKANAQTGNQFEAYMNRVFSQLRKGFQ